MNKRKNNTSPLKIAVLGHKTIPSRQGGIEIVVEELTVRMAKLGHKITVYNRNGHHVSGKEFDEKKLKEYIYGQKRLLPCDMSFDTFFIDPYGDVMPCNGTKDKEVMGNLNNQSWDELWNSSQAEEVRKKVRCCDRDCWMIGSVSPAMHKYIWKPATWVLVHKFKALFTKQPYSMYENKICCDYRDGKVTKEELDKCSTCDINCVIDNGLSEASKEQLKHKSGEEIVDEDIANQLGNK